MMVGPCWCLGACYFSVPSLPLLDRVSSSGRCWDTSGSLVKAMAAEEDQEHAAIFQFSKTSHKEELAVLCNPVLAGTKQLSALSYWLNWAEMED